MPSAEPLAAAAAAAPRAAFAHRDFRRFAASSLLANLAEQMVAVAVGWQLYAITHRALDLGYVGLVQFAPAVALSLPAGHLADRVDRARILAACQLALALSSAALLALTWRGADSATSIAPIYAALLASGVARAFAAPASQAIVPGLVPPAQLANAVTWASTTWQVATIAGPALGGVVYGLGGAASVYAASAIAFLLAAAAALAIRARPIARAADDADGSAGLTWSRIFAGLRFVRAHRLIFEAVSMDLFAVLLGGATALLPVFASDILHVGPWGLGVLRSAPAAGAAALALVLAHRPLIRRAGPTLLACVALFGAATIAFGLSRNFWLSLAALLVLGAADMVSVVVRSTVVQLRTPDAMRGRVSAVSMLFIATSSDLGSLESGLTAAWLGAVPAVVVGGIGTLAVVAVYTFAFKTLRSVDRLE